MNRLLPLVVVILWLSCLPVIAETAGIDPVTVHIFYDNVIHFTPDDSAKYDTQAVSASDNGRVVSRAIDLEMPDRPVRIMANVRIKPIVKDEQSVHDKWDRAGSISMSLAGMADIEVIKFITAYGGMTKHEADVSHLSPLLNGPVTFKGFVDTWISPGWKIDFSLCFEPIEDDGSPDWALGVLNEQGVTEEKLRDGDMKVSVSIPDGMERIVMHYLVSGHCTDGTDADEFITKDNVVMVDGKEVYRFRPWRSDCLRFRVLNPYTRRWSDGNWSSDYSRSGWCPGDKVDPVAIDLTEHLSPGEHTIGFRIENIRPEDENGHFGYWRLSSHLIGWSE